MSEDHYREVDVGDAARLVEGGEVTVLDVRTPAAHERVGHIPGALLLPAGLIASAPAVLPRDGCPLLVVGEHGTESADAARLLARASDAPVFHLRGGMAAWMGPREYGAGRVRGPAAWFVRQAARLGRGGDALDVACGAGRHALLMAVAGFRVHAVDRDPEHIERLQTVADRLDLPIRPEVVDLEAPDVDLGEARYDVVLVFRYLHRPLVPVLVRALRPGGLLIYETYTIAQAARGRPLNPAFLLEAGELPRLVAPLAVVDAREGEFEDGMVASVVAVKR